MWSAHRRLLSQAGLQSGQLIRSLVVYINHIGHLNIQEGIICSTKVARTCCSNSGTMSSSDLADYRGVLGPSSATGLEDRSEGRLDHGSNKQSIDMAIV